MRLAVDSNTFYMKGWKIKFARYWAIPRFALTEKLYHRESAA
jgi:hypothetical protein